MNKKKRYDNFKKDLKVLLKKHEATIVFMLGEGSDTHGLYDEAIGVQFLEDLKKGDRYRSWSPEEKLSDGYSCHPGTMDYVGGD